MLRLQRSESLASSALARQVASGSPAASSLTPAPAVEITPRVPRAPPTASDMVTVPSGEYQQLLDDMRKMKVIIKGHEKRIKLLEDQAKQLEADLYTEGEAPPPDHSSAVPVDATDASNGHAHAVSSARHYVNAHAVAHSGSGSGSQTSSKHASATQSPAAGQSPAPLISASSGTTSYDDAVHL